MFFCIILLVLLFVEASSRDPKYVDPFCLLTGRPAVDPAVSNDLINLRRQQKCNLYIQGGGIGDFTYIMNHNNYWLVNSVVATLTKANLDQGTDTTFKLTLTAFSTFSPVHWISGQHSRRRRRQWST